MRPLRSPPRGVRGVEVTAKSTLGARALEPDGITRTFRTRAPNIRVRIDEKFPRRNCATESERKTAARDQLEAALRSELVPPFEPDQI